MINPNPNHLYWKAVGTFSQRHCSNQVTMVPSTMVPSTMVPSTIAYEIHSTFPRFVYTYPGKQTTFSSSHVPFATTIKVVCTRCIVSIQVSQLLRSWDNKDLRQNLSDTEHRCSFSNDNEKKRVSNLQWNLSIADTLGYLSWLVRCPCFRGVL